MHEPAWGLLIVVYLFCGGLSGGALMLSSAAHLGGRTPHHASIARLGALAAPLPVIAGTALLVLDLGRPFFFWKLFFAIKPFSPMWVGSWLLAVFCAVSLAYAYLFLPLSWQRWTFSRAATWRNRLAIVGLPLGLSVAVYTAVLLGVLVARPLWNTPLVAFLFVLSALSSAAALLMVVTPHSDHRVLSRLDAGLITLELLVLAALLFYGAVSFSTARHAVAVLAGEFAWSFWGGVVLLGLVLPLTLEWQVQSRAAAPPALAAAASWLVLLGGFLLRYVIVYAGQATGLS